MTMADQASDGHRVLSDQDFYFSVDVETDGPIPGDYSMLSFAIVVAGYHDGHRFVSAEEPSVGYWELKPISDQFDRDAMSINRLDRQALTANGVDPRAAMKDASSWVLNHSQGRRPVMVGSPIGFDWMFMHWYFIKFLGESPFGHSSAFDLKTAISVRFDRPVAMSGRRNFPQWMGSDIQHTHNARDDAMKQAEEFQSIREWRGPSDAGDIN